jgi:hypothetical protein
MTSIALIDKADLAFWQRIFKRDETRRLYWLFLGNLAPASGDCRVATVLLIEALATATGGDAEAVGRMIRQTALSQDGWDEQLTPTASVTWLEGRIANAVRRVQKKAVRHDHRASGELAGVRA